MDFFLPVAQVQVDLLLIIFLSLSVGFISVFISIFIGLFLIRNRLLRGSLSLYLFLFLLISPLPLMLIEIFYGDLFVQINAMKNFSVFAGQVGFLEHNYDLKLENYKYSKIKTRVERVTNDTYLKVFQSNLFKTPVMPNSQSVMKNEVTLELNTDNNNFKSGIELYENLGVKNSDRYQYVFPYYEFTRSLINDDLSGSLTFSSYGSNNLINTNNLTTKVTNNISYISPKYRQSMHLCLAEFLWGQNHLWNGSIAHSCG